MIDVDLVGGTESLRYEGKSGSAEDGAIMNGFHGVVYGRGYDEGFLFTFNRRENPLFYRTMDVSEFSVNGVRLDEVLINFQKDFIKENGIFIEDELTEQLKQNLLYSYLLQSALCYVEFYDGEETIGMIVSQCYELLKNFGVDDWMVQPSKTEIESSVFGVMRVWPQYDRVEPAVVDLKKVKLFTTRYAMQNLYSYLYFELLGGVFDVSYSIDKNVDSIITTRDNESLTNQWSNDDLYGVDLEVKIRVEEDFANRFSIVLPNLEAPGEMVVVPIVDIKEIFRHS